MNELIMILVDELYPHPDNPRKDLGDLTELADSIKENGVMQNLTVVEGHRQTREEFLKLGEGTGLTEEEILEGYDPNFRLGSGYTVVIGHRRLAAAKEAGLTELPCVISDMDEPQQLEIMLVENMQRTDLTLLEQAEGIQMCLDLGITVSELAKETGFSESTIRRRKALTEYDRDKVKAAMGRQVTLADFEQLNRIKDPEHRNEVLETIGTADFRISVAQMISREKFEAEKAKVVEILKKTCVQIERKGYVTDEPGEEPIQMNQVTFIARWNIDKWIKGEKTAKEGFFIDHKDGIEVLVERKDDSEDDQKRKAMVQEYAERSILIQKESNDIAEVMTKLRTEFAKSYKVKKGDAIRAVEWMKSQSSMYIYRDLIKSTEADNAETWLVRLAFGAAEARTYTKDCCVRKYNGEFYLLNFAKNEGLNENYELLTEFGYEMSQEEKEYMNGTHDIYDKMKKLKEDWENE